MLLRDSVKSVNSALQKCTDSASVKREAGNNSCAHATNRYCAPAFVPGTVLGPEAQQNKRVQIPAQRGATKVGELTHKQPKYVVCFTDKSMLQEIIKSNRLSLLIEQFCPLSPSSRGSPRACCFSQNIWLSQVASRHHLLSLGGSHSSSVLLDSWLSESGARELTASHQEVESSSLAVQTVGDEGFRETGKPVSWWPP